MGSKSTLPTASVSTPPPKADSTLVRINALGLDSSTVAYVWAEAFRQSWSPTTTPWLPVIISLSTGMAYLADRMMDATFRHSKAFPLAPRHQILWTYRSRLLMILAGFFVTTVLLAFHTLTRPQVTRGFILLVPVALYLLAAQTQPFNRTPIKEGLMAALFSVSSWVLLDTGFDELSVAPLAGWFWICFLNGILLSHWETQVQGVSSHHPSTSQSFWKGTPFGPLLWISSLILLLMAWMDGQQESSQLLYCLSAAAFGMGILEVQGSCIPVDHRRVWADGCLLTPLVWIALHFA